ncbi:class E sortase [Actinospongicola halichondriae]|uniref:class E sortase n=1 Tax=Actinospongicola halichondriae TaxID=3236844 RepID=UPI003D5556BE
MRTRALGAAIAALLIADVAVIAVDLTTQTDDNIAAAAVALASTAEPVETDLDPLAGIVVDVQRPEDIDPSIELPQPEPAPSNPYAPTAEVRHGTLEIPAIGLSQTLFEGVTLTAINRGPSHWPGSAMPGEVGNVVVAGHRTTYSKPFWALNELVPGDELIFTIDGTETVYVLDRTEIVYPTDIHIIEQTHERTATLFACHPRGSARQRIVGHFTIKNTTPIEFFDTIGPGSPIGDL